MVPTSLRVKRDNINNKSNPASIIPVKSTHQSLNTHTNRTDNAMVPRAALQSTSAPLQIRTQDDAYEDFMKEMQNLL